MLQDAVDFAQFFGKVNRFTKKMDEFSQRLREERKRLGLSQEAFASLGGVSKNTQSNYETGANLPDVGYLNTIRGFGVDSGYVLTGIRTFDPSAIEHAQPAATLAARLVQERKRLELTVGQLAAKSGVDRLALLKFEEGEFAPDAKALQQLHAVGVDVGYVLLSLRAGAAGGDAGAAASVSSESQQLLQHYDKAPAEAQAALRTLAAIAARA
ncbi:MAG: transcriptional regulator [Delftia acidovorans]|nr:MAG: transcriptional regulator [Delftia acidovorans]